MRSHRTTVSAILQTVEQVCTTLRFDVQLNRSIIIPAPADSRFPARLPTSDDEFALHRLDCRKCGLFQRGVQELDSMDGVDVPVHNMCPVPKWLEFGAVAFIDSPQPKGGPYGGYGVNPEQVLLFDAPSSLPPPSRRFWLASLFPRS